MAITSDRLRQTFSEGGAWEIYHEIKSSGDFLGFTKQYAFGADYRVARMIIAYYKPAVKGLRAKILSGKYHNT